jgi:quercetin dioxygenase-like cupin family protein
MIDMETSVKIVDKNEGELLGVAGGNYRIIISGDETDGNYAVIEMLVPPGGGPPPHAHPDTQEMFFLVEGVLEFKTEKGKTTVKEGGFINIPFGGAVHCFKNESDQIARMLCTVVPSGLEKVFQEIGSPVQHGKFLPVPELSEERKEFLRQIDEKYGQKTYPKNYLD